MNIVTFTRPSVHIFIYKTSRLISNKFRMEGFTISCRGNLISVGNSVIIESFIKFISMADICPNSAKLWVHNDGRKAKGKKRTILQCQ